MSTIVQATTGVAAQGVPFTQITWVIGAICGAAMAAASGAWWFSRQQSTTRRDLYVKINRVEREMRSEVVTNKESCTNTKQRVSLLEQSHGHLEQRMDGVDDKLDAMQTDITTTKEGLTALSQKQSEQHLAVIGEIRSLGDKLLIHQLSKNQEKRG